MQKILKTKIIMENIYRIEFDRDVYCNVYKGYIRYYMISAISEEDAITKCKETYPDGIILKIITYPCDFE